MRYLVLAVVCLVLGWGIGFLTQSRRLARDEHLLDEVYTRLEDVEHRALELDARLAVHQDEIDKLYVFAAQLKDPRQRKDSRVARSR